MVAIIFSPSQVKKKKFQKSKVQKSSITCSEEVMVSFDVKSLFSSIPVDLALTVTKERLQQDQNLAERTYLSVDNILKLSDFVLNQLLQIIMMATTINKILDVPWVVLLVQF